ncbi:MAG: RDD family protein, partial [Acidobacteriia bacterium]|nr:RDD family protein [Terriglobia bacterium]
EIAALCFVLFLLFRDINGKSPGKLVTGTMVVGRAGSPSTTKQRLIRNLPFAITMLPLFIPILGYISYGLLDLMFLIESIIVLAGKRRIGDQMAGTIVVRRNTLPIRQARLNLEV